MPDTGILNPSSSSEQADGGTHSWNDLTWAYAYGGNYASAGVGKDEDTWSARFTGFGASIPAGATILGIQVGPRCRCNGEDDSVSDLVMQMIKGGSYYGQNKAVGGYWINNPSWQVRTRGSSTDLWGGTWTPADINASNFGFRIQANGHHGGAWADIDVIDLKVWYELGFTDIDKIYGIPVSDIAKINGISIVDIEKFNRMG